MILATKSGAAVFCCLAVALGLYFFDSYEKEKPVSPDDLKGAISGSECVRKALVQFVIDGQVINQKTKDETVVRCQVVDSQRKAFESQGY